MADTGVPEVETMTPAEEEHYQAIVDSLRDLWDGTADEEDLALVCSACGIDAEDL